MKLKLFKILVNYIIYFGWSGVKYFWKVHFGKNPEILIQLPFLKHQVILRRGTSDIEVFNQIFFNEEYKFSKKTNTNNVEYIIDCGANNGLSALFFHQLFPNAKIIAIELEKNNFDMLQRNTSGISNIIPLHAGVWYEDAPLNINNEEKGSNWEFIASSANPEQVEIDNEHTTSTIEGITIQTILERFKFPRIDILKVDIESAEKELFEYSSASFLPKTRIILIELHDWIKPDCTKTFFAALSGYSYLNLCRGENMSCEILHTKPLI